jgi:hypothetical protein
VGGFHALRFSGVSDRRTPRELPYETVGSRLPKPKIAKLMFGDDSTPAIDAAAPRRESGIDESPRRFCDDIEDRNNDSMRSG